MPGSIVVTGAAGGIGAAIARAAAAEGYRVGVLDLDGDGASEVASSLPDAVALTGSVTVEADVERALDTFGAVPDAFVNNAGIVRFGPLADLTVDDWRTVVDVNLTGTFVAGRAVATRMMARGSGAIVNITSINGISPGPYSGAYAAAKAGVSLLTQQMALEWGPSGVRVNGVAPGLIDGGMSAEIFADERFRALRAERVPLGRLGRSEDVADAVMFLVSDRASYVSGALVVVDGGVVNSVIAGLPRPPSVDGVGPDRTGN